MRCRNFALVALAVAAAGCGSQTDSTPAQRLAQADGLAASEDALASYRFELARLRRICTEAPAELADRAIAGREHLHDLNIPDSALAVLRDAADLAAGRAATGGRRSCADDFADALTGLEQNGR